MKFSFALFALAACSEHTDDNFRLSYLNQNKNVAFANPHVAAMTSCGPNCKETNIDMGVIDIPEIADHHLRTRTYGQNGHMLPPGSLMIKALPGDTLRINFKNTLVQQATANTIEGELINGSWHGIENRYRNPDHTNLHTHGFYVSPGSVSNHRGSDDILTEIPGAELMQEKLSENGGGVVGPGGTHIYEYQIPTDHMPGTLWVHAHYHGSTSLQVGGGAAMALIIEDPKDYLPEQVEEADDNVLMVSLMSNGCFRNNLTEVAEVMGDQVFLLDPLHPAEGYWTPGGFADNPPSQAPLEGSLRCFHLLNGKHQPTMAMGLNEWQRWRVVNTGISQDVLQLKVSDGCEMQLLAKDSIYIDDFPRKVNQAIVPAGGRADVMVRCSVAGDHSITVNGDFPDLLGPENPDHCLGAPMNRAAVVAGNLTAAMCPKNHWREVLAKITVTDAAAATAPTGTEDDNTETTKAKYLRSTAVHEKKDLAAWKPVRPRYQLDQMYPTPQDTADTCSCPYDFAISFPNASAPGPHPAIGRKIFFGVDFSINNEIWNPHKYMHVSSIDQVQERVVESSFHPYHQHIYPFQLVTEQFADEPYFKPGDWHDVYMHQWKFGYYINAAGNLIGLADDKYPGAEAYGPYNADGTRPKDLLQPGGTKWTMRYKPTKFYGNIVMHCHILEHEDTGMMTMEYLLPERNNTCMCNYKDNLASTATVADRGGWLTDTYKGVLGPAISPNLLGQTKGTASKSSSSKSSNRNRCGMSWPSASKNAGAASCTVDGDCAAGETCYAAGRTGWGKRLRGGHRA